MFVNDYTDCSRYYSCLNGVGLSITCPDGRWFHPDPAGCYEAESVPCLRCPSEGVINVGVSGSCTDFTLCINGNEIPQSCGAGLRFDPIDGRCNLRELVPCTYDRCPATGSVLVPDETSCSHYFVCVNGEQLARRECAPSLRFDPVRLSCAREEDVACPLRAIPFIPTVPNVIPTAPTARPRRKLKFGA